MLATPQRGPPALGVPMDDDETTPGFQDAGDQLDAGLGGAALQDSDRGGAAAERTLQRRAARRAKGSRRKDARLKQQLATNLALASARSPLHAELPTSGESAGEGEGDADVVVGDIVDVYPQAVGADLIPDMDGGTITVVDAVLEEIMSFPYAIQLLSRVRSQN